MTPRSFLALLDTFIHVYESAHASRVMQIDRLVKGQRKLEEAEKDTEIMEKELIVKITERSVTRGGVLTSFGREEVVSSA